MSSGMSKTPPDWFTRALAAPRRSRFVEVAGCPIHYLSWGDPALPGLLLVPGTGGHAHWFAHVGPLLADQFHVVAMDMGGAGDSGRRPAYSAALIVEEIMGVCADSGMLAAAVPPVILGHSLSGQFTLQAAMAKGEAFLGVIVLDGLRHGVLEKDPAVKTAREGRATTGRPQRLYPDRETAVARFRLTPDPGIPIETDYVLAHIAEHSVQATEGGWTWKHDRSQSHMWIVDLDLKNKIAALPCRVAAIYGETSHLVGESLIADLTEATGGTVPFVIPGTSHFPMIDSPLAFVAAVKGVALSWVAEWRRVHG
jgi:pimeloyl-ACP methyl ester carboxylesterase